VGVAQIHVRVVEIGGPARHQRVCSFEYDSHDRQRKEKAQRRSGFAARAGSTGPVYDMGIDWGQSLVGLFSRFPRQSTEDNMGLPWLKSLSSSRTSSGFPFLMRTSSASPRRARWWTT